MGTFGQWSLGTFGQWSLETRIRNGPNEWPSSPENKGVGPSPADPRHSPCTAIGLYCSLGPSTGQGRHTASHAARGGGRGVPKTQSSPTATHTEHTITNKEDHSHHTRTPTQSIQGQKGHSHHPRPPTQRTQDQKDHFHQSQSLHKAHKASKKGPIPQLAIQRSMP